MWGAYAQASYFLTGENRRYKTSSGVWTYVEPNKPFNPFEGRWGAWEIAARYSYFDGDDQAINGGREQNVTAGVNWYLFSAVRLMLNYVWADVKDTGDADRSGFGFTNASGNIHIIETRFQVEF